MKKTLQFAILTSLALACADSTSSESSSLFKRSNDKIVLPQNYESLSAAEKEDLLFSAMKESRYESKLPDLVAVNPLKFILSRLRFKMENTGDEAPVGYEKSLHAHGVAAKVKFEAEAGHPYTGLFQGVDHGIIRLSFTSTSKGNPVAPGIALKFLIDGQPSQNVSALYKLSGQGQNHNFFANELSNIIPAEKDPKSIFSQSIFLRASRYPTKIAVRAFADRDQLGNAALNPKAPTQLFFVPNHALDGAEGAHDFREDLLKIPAGTVLYDLYAADGEDRNSAVKIGRLVLRSEFLASQFGDSRIFFKHHRFEGDR